MKHQITLLGGQILPIYWGIVEKSPNKIHLLYTKETRDHLQILKRIFSKLTFETYQVDPYDFSGIKELVEKIIFSNKNEGFQLNLTSGTKVMALACQSVFSTLKFDVFYIDQKHRVFDLAKETFEPVNNSIKIKTFLELSGHSQFNSQKIGDYSKEEQRLANEVFDLTKSNSGIKKLFRSVRLKCGKIDTSTSFSHVMQNGDKVVWKNNSLFIRLKSHQLQSNSNNAFRIIFGGLWWELVIAQITTKWKHSKEQFLGVDIETKKSKGVSKNEIDILHSTGKSLVFIECKSGNVSQADINKIRAVKRLYGGVSSKSILICRYMPRKDLQEKCNDFGIEIFTYNGGNTSNKNSNVVPIGNINEINKKLDLLISRFEI